MKAMAIPSRVRTGYCAGLVCGNTTVRAGDSRRYDFEVRGGLRLVAGRRRQSGRRFEPMDCAASSRQARTGLGVAMVDGQILAIGGFDFTSGQVFDSVEARRETAQGTGVTWRPCRPVVPMSPPPTCAARLRGRRLR